MKRLLAAAALGIFGMGCTDSPNPTAVSLSEDVGTISASFHAGPLVNLQPKQCRLEGKLRSHRSPFVTPVTFVNNTSADIRIFWLDFTGDRQFYFSLAPEAEQIQETFVTHPWVVTDESDNCIAIFIPNGSFGSIATIG